MLFWKWLMTVGLTGDPECDGWTLSQPNWIPHAADIVACIWRLDLVDDQRLRLKCTVELNPVLQPSDLWPYGRYRPNEGAVELHRLPFLYSLWHLKLEHWSICERQYYTDCITLFVLHWLWYICITIVVLHCLYYTDHITLVVVHCLYKLNVLHCLHYIGCIPLAALQWLDYANCFTLIATQIETCGKINVYICHRLSVTHTALWEHTALTLQDWCQPCSSHDMCSSRRHERHPVTSTPTCLGHHPRSVSSNFSSTHICRCLMAWHQSLDTVGSRSCLSWESHSLEALCPLSVGLTTQQPCTLNMGCSCLFHCFLFMYKL